MRASLLRSLVLALCVYGGSLVAADDPFLGTWKLNPEKSTVQGRSVFPSSALARYELDSAGNLILTIDGFRDGRAMHFKSIARFDGCEDIERPVAVERVFDEIGAWPRSARTIPVAVSCTQLDSAQTLSTASYRAGRLVESSESMISGNGHVLVMVTAGMDEKGNYYRSTLIWDRQQ